MPLLSSARPPAAETCPSPERVMQVDSQGAGATSWHRCLGYRWYALPFKRYLKKGGIDIHVYVFVCVCACMYVCVYIYTHTLAYIIYM